MRSNSTQCKSNIISLFEFHHSNRILVLLKFHMNFTKQFNNFSRDHTAATKGRTSNHCAGRISPVHSLLCGWMDGCNREKSITVIHNQKIPFGNYFGKNLQTNLGDLEYFHQATVQDNLQSHQWNYWCHILCILLHTEPNSI